VEQRVLELLVAILSRMGIVRPVAILGRQGQRRGDDEAGTDMRGAGDSSNHLCRRPG
jgi:hypothetical protein